jgi:polygalacturonase
MIQRVLLCLLLAPLVALYAQLPRPVALSVSVNTNGVVIAPASFWAANSNLMSAASPPARGAVTNIGWNSRHFTVSGTNVSLAATWSMTNALLMSFGLTNNFEVGDASNLTLDGVNTGIYGVESLYADGGITTVRGLTNLNLITPRVFAGSALSGQYLRLSDDLEGTVEYADAVESVASVSQMLTLSGRTTKSVRTLGYSLAGDGGGGVYYWVNSTTGTNAYGGRISNGSGAWVLLDRPVSLFQFGLRSGSTSEASNNAARIQAAITWAASGGHLVLPNNGSTVYVGPNSIRPNTAVTNLTLELHGVIQVPATATWDTTHPSLFHFSDAGTYNSLAIIGTATINGNATNQTTSSGNNYGKQLGFWFDNATNLTVSGIKVEAFGSFGIYVRNSDRVMLRDLRIAQTHGNNDTYPDRWGANADGIHVGNSRNVSIIGCDIESTDDCISFTQYAASQVSTNFLVANNTLRPYAPNATNVPSGIRLGSEGGITNTTISDVLISGNIIKPVGANGMYIGVLNAATSRELRRIKIHGNIIDGANQLGAVQIGPNAGTATAHNVVFSGGLIIQHAHDIDVSGNTIANARSKAIGLANCGLVTLRANVITNVTDSVGGGAPRGVGVHLQWGSYGDTDDVTIDGNTITGTDGGAIYGDGANYSTKVLRVKNNVISGWLRGLYSSQSRSHPAILANRGLTNLIEGNRFVNGEGSTIVISASSTSSRHEIIGNTMPMRILTPGSGVGGTEHIRVTLNGSTAGAVVRINGNTIGGYDGRAMILENIGSAHIIGNQFVSDELASTVGPEMAYVNFTSGSSGSGTYIVANNLAHIASKLGSNPSTFLRTYNNNGSGGSTVTLTTVAAQNIITPSSGMAHVLDAFAGGARDLTYGSTTTIPNSAEMPVRHRVALTGDTTLAWTSPSPGQRGALDIYPDTSTRTVTLPMAAYSPTGATFSVAGGTGSTNYVRMMWEVHQVGGTNRITVVPQLVYR